MSTEEPQSVETSTVPPSTKEELATKLNQLKATATQQYALKNFAAAAETYSEAAEVQDEVNGEMATQNAELLYQYGRCLYHLGVSKSDVLGGKVAQQEEPKRKKRKIARDEDEPTPKAESSAAAAPVADSASANGASAAKPFFQITGDENWSDSDSEDEEHAEEQAEEEDDDLAIAYEILDTARVLYHRKLTALKEDTATLATKPESEIRTLQERLADTHDLQAEIKLENEQFADAVNDAQQTLSYRLELYPIESGMIAEAHYKLSIALDFASMPTQTESGEADPNQLSEERRADMRQQAADQMEKAILSCQARLRKDEALVGSQSGIELERTKRSIADAKDLVQDMKNRLVDLRNPIANITNELEAGNPLKGLLGEMLGQSKAEQMKTLAAATANANDLSGLVKQRKKPKPESTEAPTDFNDKRKLEDDIESTSKKVKFES